MLWVSINSARLKSVPRMALLNKLNEEGSVKNINALKTCSGAIKPNLER
jgi:hypothetical protein